ncbi:MAG TPA: hypothetical protein VHR45_09235 [Thermoanaerobaculia bacterium]|nr:hypothetical protein [Thermoanaerobaculia bacterium]
MSRGDSFSQSGLGDQGFDGDPLVKTVHQAANPKFIYIEYPIPADELDLLAQAAAHRAPFRRPGDGKASEKAPELPVIKVGPAAIPPILNGVGFDGAPLGYGFRGGAAKAVPAVDSGFALPGPPAATLAVHAEDLCIERHPDSGSVILSWRPRGTDREFSAAEERDFERVANGLLGDLISGLGDPGLPQAKDDAARIVMRDTVAMQMRVDQTAANQPAGKEEVVPTDRCLYLRQTMAVRYQGHDIPILGEGGESFFGRCPAGGSPRPSPVPGPDAASNVCQRTDESLVSFVYNDRAYQGTRESATQKTRVTAENEAKAELERSIPPLAADYELKSFRWGYRAAPAHCKQEEMYLVYQFDFLPRPKSRFSGYPPVTIEVPAHDLGGKKRIEETWTCSLEEPAP